MRLLIVTILLAAGLYWSWLQFHKPNSLVGSVVGTSHIEIPRPGSKPSQNISNPSAASSAITPIEEPLSFGNYDFKNRPLPDLEKLRELFPSIVLIIDKPRNRLSFKVKKDDLLLLLQTLNDMDKPVDLVRLNMILVSANLNSSETFSFQWLLQYASSGLVGPVGYGLGINAVNQLVLNQDMIGLFKTSLQAAATKGALHVITRPSIVVASGSEGLISSGREVAVPVSNAQNGTVSTTITYKTVSLQVKVTPTVTANGIHLIVEQKNDDIASTKNIGGNEVPELSTQSLTTSLDLKSGDWASVGGINILNKNKTITGIPILMDIPLIGSFFGSKRKTNNRLELGIFLQPELVTTTLPCSEPKFEDKPQFKKPSPSPRCEPQASPAQPALAGALESHAAAGGI